jgi:hypothetical protein
MNLVKEEAPAVYVLQCITPSDIEFETHPDLTKLLFKLSKEDLTTHVLIRPGESQRGIDRMTKHDCMFASNSIGLRSVIPIDNPLLLENKLHEWLRFSSKFSQNSWHALHKDKLCEFDTITRTTTVLN